MWRAKILKLNSKLKHFSGVRLDPLKCFYMLILFKFTWLQAVIDYWETKTDAYVDASDKIIQVRNEFLQC